MKTVFKSALMFSLLALISCGGEEESSGETSETNEEVVDPCVDATSLNVEFDAQSRGSDTSYYSNDGAFDVVQQDIIFFHDSTIVLKIDNYEGKRETGDQIELYISLYTKDGKVLQEGEYPLTPGESMSSNILIYVGTGMVVSPGHIAEGKVSVSSYSKEKVCGSLELSMNDDTYGTVNLSGDFSVEAQ